MRASGCARRRAEPRPTFPSCARARRASRSTSGDAVALAATRVIVTAPFTESEASTAYPGYAELDLAPLLRNAKDAVHIAIVPVYPLYGPNFWAMVSITDNDTQRVTLATP